MKRLPAIAVLAFLVALSAGRAAADSVTIPSGDNWFCDPSYQLGDCPTEISVGDSVTWTYPSGATVHTTTECGDSCDAPTGTPAWDSGFMFVGDTFTWTFDEPGVFPYYCTLHPSDMRGTISVLAQPTPTPTATPTPPPSVTPTPTVVTRAPEDGAAEDGGDTETASEAVRELPSSGGPPPGGAVKPWTIVAGAALVAAATALAMRRRSGRE